MESPFTRPPRQMESRSAIFFYPQRLFGGKQKELIRYRDRSDGGLRRRESRNVARAMARARAPTTPLVRTSRHDKKSEKKREEHRLDAAARARIMLGFS
jgi:hypothetical protein